MTGKNKMGLKSGKAYREEPVKPAIYTMLIIVAVVALPLGWLNQKIGAEGLKIADTSRYQELLTSVNRNVTTLQQMLDNETVGEQALKGSSGPKVKLITQNVLQTNSEDTVLQNTEPFKIELSGIYWTKDPIATINGENYRTGETIMGHRIVEIRKSEVVFEDPMGEKMVKRYYDFLDTSPEDPQ